jgi:hypothetical protein
MRVDLAVTRLKYDREVVRLQQQRNDLEKRGVILLSSTSFPYIDLIYIPRQRLGVIIPVTQQKGLFLQSISQTAAEVPILSGVAFKAHFDLSNYDLDPPSLEFRDPWTDQVLQYNAMLRALQFDEHRKGQHVLLDDHPFTHKPFLCLRGIREYHEHPQHSGNGCCIVEA